MMTNEQRIRTMSLEELAEFIRGTPVCPGNEAKNCSAYDSCRDCWISWLQRPAEESE